MAKHETDEPKRDLAAATEYAERVFLPLAPDLGRAHRDYLNAAEHVQFVVPAGTPLVDGDQFLGVTVRVDPDLSTPTVRFHGEGRPRELVRPRRAVDPA